MPYVRREYIAGKPQSKIAKFSSGQPSNNYDFKLELLVTENIQIRHNALEADWLSLPTKECHKQERLRSFLN